MRNMSMRFKMVAVMGIVFSLIGCASTTKLAYQGAGAGLGGGMGYLVERKPIHAAIGGTAGVLAGGWLYDVENRRQLKQYDKGFGDGYKKAQLNCAVENWDKNTGKKEEKSPIIKNYQRIKVPKQEVNGVIYDEHCETVEVIS